MVEWLPLALNVFGTLYMFLALAVVCDDYLAPALDVMAGRLKLPPDAAAVLLAAGSAAPELFTSLVGTFSGTDVGFGTVVGSAAFRVLLVVGTLATFSRETLELSWWPLVRDATFCAAALLGVAAFFGLNSPAQIELWEAGTLLALYLGYVTLMASSGREHTCLTGRAEADSFVKLEEGESATEAATEPADAVHSPLLAAYKVRPTVKDAFLAPEVVAEAFERYGARELKGRVHATFGPHVPAHVPASELRGLMERLGHRECSDTMLYMLLARLDLDEDGKIGYDLFEPWYVGRQRYIDDAINRAFREGGAHPVDGTIDLEAARRALQGLNPLQLCGDEQAAELKLAIDGLLQAKRERRARLSGRRDGRRGPPTSAGMDSRDNNTCPPAQACPPTGTGGSRASTSSLAAAADAAGGAAPAAVDPSVSGAVAVGGAEGGAASGGVVEVGAGPRGGVAGGEDGGGRKGPIIDPSLGRAEEDAIRSEASGTCAGGRPTGGGKTASSAAHTPSKGGGKAGPSSVSKPKQPAPPPSPPPSPPPDGTDGTEGTEATEGDEGDDGRISREDFKEWYADTPLWEELMKQADREVEEEQDLALCPPAASGCAARLRFFFLLPILVCTKLTLPDVRVGGKQYWYPVTVLGALCWIGFLTSKMVLWATAVGAAFSLPPALTGSTFLAAGLSAPTLLTALVVAQQGHGAIAVSTSLCVPIFSLLVGLPLPWLAYSLAHATPVSLGASPLYGTLVLLFSILSLLVCTVACFGWRLTRCLGLCMLLLYLLSVAQDVGRTFTLLSLPYLE